MSGLKKHGDPLEDEIRRDPARGVEEVASNQPGSKGDGSVSRAGSGARGTDEAMEGEFVRSADQKPNPNQPDDDATRPLGNTDGGRSNM